MSRPPPIKTEEYEKVLELLFEGKSQRAIEAETKIPRRHISNIFKNPELKELLTARAKLEVSKILPDAVNVLKKLVIEGNMDAVKTVFKIVGAMEPEAQGAKSEQQLTIILPGASQEPKTFVSPVIGVSDESDSSKN